MPVMLGHSIGLDTLAGLAVALGLEMREDMHPSGVEPDEERLVGLVLPVDEILGGRQELLVDRFHALRVQRACILDAAVGVGMDDAAWPELLPELRILRIEIA